MNNNREYTVSLKKRPVAHIPTSGAIRLSERVVLTRTPLVSSIVVEKVTPIPVLPQQPRHPRQSNQSGRSYLSIFKEELEILGQVLYLRRSSLITSVVSLLLTLISSGALVQTLFFDNPLTANAANAEVTLFADELR